MTQPPRMLSARGVPSGSSCYENASSGSQDIRPNGSPNDLLATEGVGLQIRMPLKEVAEGQSAKPNAKGWSKARESL